MRLVSLFVSFLLLTLYGICIFFLLNQGDINNFSLNANQLNSEYDYIVVGGGSAGSVVASRLAQNGLQVLLLEAGGSDEVPEVKMPVGFGAIISQPEMKHLIWDHTAKFQKENYTKEIEFPRGKIIGGCGSINGNVWNKGSKSIYDLWEKKGAKGWKYQDIEKYYEKAENTLWISKGGRFIHQASRDVLNEAGKLFGFTEINKKQTGFGVYETTMRNGRRWSTADAYLKPTLKKFGDKLHLSLNSTVNKITFNEKKNRAVGVVLGNGKTIKAKKEVILSAGAFGSPAILMRSGVGNSTELKNYGIEITHDLPGVGKNLQDHPTTSFIVRTNDSRWDSLTGKPEPVSWQKLVDYLVFGSGQFSSNIVEVGGYIKTKYGQFKEIDDVQFHCGAAFLPPKELVLEQQKDNRTENYIACAITLVTARDKGSVHLKSKSPEDLLEIKINFLEHNDDLKSMLEGFSVVNKIFDTPSFKEKVLRYLPSEESLGDSEKLKLHIYKSLFEVYHPTGTCKIGDIKTDSEAVLDYTLRVRGFENLRVIDASVMPEIVNSNTNAPTIMIAEKGSHMIVNGV